MLLRAGIELIEAQVLARVRRIEGRDAPPEQFECSRIVRPAVADRERDAVHEFVLRHRPEVRKELHVDAQRRGRVASRLPRRLRLDLENVNQVEVKHFRQRGQVNDADAEVAWALDLHREA
jgi:hypothetical protein